MPLSCNRAFENKIVTQSGLFVNEIGCGVLQSSAQQTLALHEYQRHKTSATHYVSILFTLSEIFEDCMFVERWMGVLQVQPRFRINYVIILFSECSIAIKWHLQRGTYFRIYLNRGKHSIALHLKLLYPGFISEETLRPDRGQDNGLLFFQEVGQPLHRSLLF